MGDVGIMVIEYLDYEENSGWNSEKEHLRHGKTRLRL